MYTSDIPSYVSGSFANDFIITGQKTTHIIRQVKRRKDTNFVRKEFGAIPQSSWGIGYEITNGHLTSDVRVETIKTRTELRTL